MNKQFIKDMADSLFPSASRDLIEVTLKQVYLEGKKDGIAYAKKILKEIKLDKKHYD